MLLWFVTVSLSSCEEVGPDGHALEAAICILFIWRLASSELEDAILLGALATRAVSWEPVHVGSNGFWFTELSFRFAAAFRATFLALSSISNTDRGFFFFDELFSTKSWSNTPHKPLLLITASKVLLLSAVGFFSSWFSDSVCTVVISTPPPPVICPVSVISFESAFRVKRSLRSFWEKRRLCLGSCKTWLVNAVLKIWRWYIFSSIVPAVINLYTVTSLFWPNRYALSLAWASVWGFQSGSYIKTLFAPVIFRPTPPVRVVISIQKYDSSVLNLSTSFCLAAMLVLPSNRQYFHPCWLVKFSMMFNIFLHCVNIMTLWPCFFQRGKILDRTWSFPDLSANLSWSYTSSSSDEELPSSSNIESLLGPTKRLGWLQIFLIIVIAFNIWTEPLITLITSSDLKYSSYKLRCFDDSRQNNTCSVLPGILLTSFTSFFCLLSKYGLMRSLSTSAQRYANCTCIGLALLYPPLLIGWENSASNAGNVPSRPGCIKSNRLHSSRKSFWIGVPDNSSRWGVRNRLHASVTSASGLRIFCPSSKTT